MKTKNFQLSRFLRRLAALVVAGISLIMPVCLAITIPNCIIEIEDNAFDDADAFSTVKVPETVRVIGSHAFDNCDRVTDIYVLNKNVILGLDALGTNTGITLHGPLESQVETYAADHGMKFIYTDTSPKADKLLKYAATQLGTSYTKHDCVTFVHECYLKALGIYTYVTCRDVEQNTKGTRINNIRDLNPGDIMCWKNDDVSYCTHVGMYVGAGTVKGKYYSSGVFIESSRGAKEVRYNHIDASKPGDYYTRNFMGAWRII